MHTRESTLGGAGVGAGARFARRWLGMALGVLALVAVVGQRGCSGSIPRQDPTGRAFPAVEGRSLEGEAVAIPGSLAGEPAVLLIGYKQKTQFDLDRWLMGLIQAGTSARVVEVPTIPGLAPTIASKWIDDGMRSGIPKEEWGSVVTLYGDDAAPVARFTGNEDGNLARVVVLDADGTVAWFDDTGYSARKAIDVAMLVDRLRR